MDFRKLVRNMKILGLVTTLLVLASWPISGVGAQEPSGVQVLVKGIPFAGAEGVMFDSNGRLHIASILGQEIVVMDPDSGEILDRIGADQGVKGPDDVAFGPDGSLYWTAILAGEVGRLSPDGVTTAQMVAPGVNPITFSDDGRLYVGLAFLGDALYELDPQLMEPPRLVAEGLGGINCFDFGPDGSIYAPNIARGAVVRIDVNAEPVTIEAVVEGEGCVKFDSQGRMIVQQDTHPHQLLRVDLDTGEKEIMAQLPIGLDNLALDSHDRVFLAHHDGTIFEALLDGTLRTASPGGLAAPAGVAVHARADGESVFVVDGGFSLREFDGMTGEQRSVDHSSFGPEERKLMTPGTVSPDGDHLILTSWFGSNVQIWDPDTHKILEEHMFAVPLNAVRFQGDFVVAELGSASVVRAKGSDPSQREAIVEGLGVPAGLAATGDDLWVSDWAAGSVLQVVADGETLADPATVVMGLSFPEGMAVAPNGHLLLVETGTGRLLSIDPATGQTSTVAEGLGVGLPAPEGAVPTLQLSSVAVGPSGAIYVTGDTANVLYKITPSATALPVTGYGPNSGLPIEFLALTGLIVIGVVIGLRRWAKAIH